MTLVEFLNAVGMQGAGQNATLYISVDGELYDVTDVTLDSEDISRLVVEVEPHEDEDIAEEAPAE